MYIPSEEHKKRELAFLASQLAEQQLRDGTAKAQVIVECMRAGSPRENIELRTAAAKVAFLEAKVAAMHTDEEVKELIEQAMSSLREYRGEDDEELY